MTDLETSEIRKRLTKECDDEQLNALCFDYYRDVYDRFSIGMTRATKIQLLLEYCVRQNQLAALQELLNDGSKSMPRSDVTENQWLLPHLVNRRDQLDELQEALQESAQQPGRPLVFVVHGYQNQSLHRFLHRLCYEDLPRNLGTSEDTPVSLIELPCPPSLTDLSELPRRLLNYLAQRIPGEHHYKSMEDLNQKLAAYPGPVLIHTHLETDDLIHNGSELITHYLRFWNTWPDIESNQQLLVFLCITYLAPRKRGVLQSLMKPCVRSKHKATLDQFLKAAPWVRECDRLICRVIREMKNVSRSEARSWAHMMEEKYQLCQCGDLVAEIHHLFEREEQHLQSGIPMETLVKRLSTLLKEYQVL